MHVPDVDCKRFEFNGEGRIKEKNREINYKINT